MRLLLDECVPRPLGRLVVGHEVHHVQTLGWAGTRNRRLLERMREQAFIGLITVDRNLAFQQNIPASGIFVVLLVAKGNRLADLSPLVPELLLVLESAQVGQVQRVGA